MIFITSNKNKVKEAEKILGLKIKAVDLYLEEVQDPDVSKVIKHKIKEAKLKLGKDFLDNNDFIVEDTALYLGRKKEIGALIKWFPIERVVKAYKGEKAKAVCAVGTKDKVFLGSIDGIITEPKGNNGFCWDKIFMPDGFDCRFAEMTTEEKNKISHRGKAFSSLALYLSKK
jgi:non-canonical purine NTP pyrophosphatase (RdgB/HAM1 family)